MEKKNTLSISNLKLVGIIAAAILAVILVGIFVVQNAQNKAFALEESVEAAMAEIEIQEMRRQSLVYNLADIVKEYDAHEAETLTAIVEGRSSIMNADEVDTAIAAVTEAYPELKSVTNYQQMMTELSITENLIAQYRNNYTEQVRAYNRY